MKFSIITVSLNNQETIAKTASSVCEQSWPDVDYLVIDGGSQDGTLERLSPYKRWITTLISEPDQGIYDAMNKGLQCASGDIIGFLNADDQYVDKMVLEQVARRFEETGADICYGDLVYVDADNPRLIRRYWRTGMGSKRELYMGWMPPHPTFFVKSCCYRKYGGYRLDLGTSADYELMLRYLLCNGLQAAYLPRVLVSMRSGGVSNASLSSRFKAHLMDWKAWLVNGIRPYPWTVPFKPLRKLGQLRSI